MVVQSENWSFYGILWILFLFLTPFLIPHLLRIPENILRFSSLILFAIGIILIVKMLEIRTGSKI